ncbi:carboxypeptidase-like regulatory domain-containing protein [Paludisphaera soli]|uniref:carboxypeptidase-like regulatory domain-containing protein n=1 Tax=Paludisphaera soli TaxID=2712865 RepID=UPI0013EBB211|nr:carboxypeptidase-like regulatory domain-containing protein [Paludisphaera soli]
MGGTTGSRFLWTALLVPPMLVLAGTAAITLWPAPVVGVLDQAAALWTRSWWSPSQPGPRAPGDGRHPFPPMNRGFMATPTPTPPRRGVVRKPDGSPLEGNFRLTTLHVGGGGFGYSAGADASVAAPRFSFQPQSERCWVVIEADGYAAAAVGPIGPRAAKAEAPPGAKAGSGPDSKPGEAPPPPPEEEEPEISVVLEEGFPHRVRVVRADGAPIARAEVHASLTVENRPAGLEPRYYTDDDGWALIPHVREVEYEFEVKVHDFALPDDTVFATLRPGVDTTIRLDRGPLSGLALDEEGRPVADALVLIAAEFDASTERTDIHPLERVIAATSDAEGRFVIPDLHKDSVYLLRVEGPDGSAGYAPGVRLNGREVRATLRPRRVVRGIVKRGPEPPQPGPSIVRVRSSIPTGFEGYGRRGGALTEYAWDQGLMLDAEGRFEYPVWESSESRLEVAGRIVPVPWPPPAAPIPIEAPPATEGRERQVEIRIVGDDAVRSRVDSLTLQLVNRPPERANLKIERLVEIQGGRGSFRALGGDSFQIEADAIPGLWTAPTRIDPAPGGGDRSVEVRVFAAGSIVGQVVDADGRPVGEGTTVLAEFDPAWVATMHQPGPTGPGGFASFVRSSPYAPPEPTATDASGRFTIAAWPLDVPCRVTVERGRFRTHAETVRLDDGTPRYEMEISLPKTASAQVRLVDPEGRPIPGETAFVRLDRPAEGTRTWPYGETDADGRIRIDDLALGEPGYTLRFAFEADYGPINAPLTPGGPALEVRAERGRTLEGRVVEAVSGWPIPGVRFSAQSLVDLDANAELVTDDDGRFRCTTLPRGDVRLANPGNMTWIAPQPSIVRAGDLTPVLLEASKLRFPGPQPKPPARP